MSPLPCSQQRAPQKSAMAIGTQRLPLRRPQPGDATTLKASIGNRNAIEWLSMPPYPDRLSDGEALFTRAIAVDASFAGTIGCERHAGLPHLGYWLGEPYCGQGSVAAAVGAGRAFYFAAADQDAIASSVLLGTEASLRVQKSFGFEIAGKTEIFCVPRAAFRHGLRTRLSRQRYKAKNK